jgi:small-conductance mechanosensitive channel
MTRPGDQFVIRRRALAMIKSEFDRAGVKFAYPTVQIASGADAAQAGAAAYRAINGSKSTEHG